jgi:outer membrane protein TolC
LEDAYKKAKKSYELQVKEYRYGLVTNLDVLQALTFMQDVKQNWDRALIQSQLDYINLTAAAEKELSP